jgi:hypothetical protein
MGYWRPGVRLHAWLHHAHTLWLHQRTRFHPEIRHSLLRFHTKVRLLQPGSLLQSFV